MSAEQNSAVVAITGVTRGLGRALLEGFVAAGHRVAGCGRDRAAIEALAARLGPPHQLAAADVTTDSVEMWAAAVVSELGPPDLLVNSAGVINRPESLWRVSGEDFDAVIDVNVKGVARVLRAFTPAMVARGRGVIVNMSSGWGRSTSAGVAPYCASKFAVEGLTRAMAEELPKGMAIVALNPGVIDTDMLRRVWGGGAAAYPEPAAWARRAVPFLLSLGPDDNGGSPTVPA